MWQRLFSALYPDSENLLPVPAQQQAEQRIRRYWLSRGWELAVGEFFLWVVLINQAEAYDRGPAVFAILVGAMFVLHLVGLIRNFTPLWLMAQLALFLIQGTVINRLGAVTSLAFLMPYTFASLLLNGRERIFVQTCAILAFWISLVHEVFAFSWQITPPLSVAVSYNILVAAFTFQTMRYLNRLAVELNTIYIAEEVQQRSQQFLARVSHELRTPLNSILGFARMLKRSTTPREGVELNTPGFGLLTETQQSYLHQIIDEGEHLNRLVSDLLDSAHLATGKLTLKLEPCDLNALCTAVAEEHRPAIPDQVRFTLACTPDLPPLQADPIRLRQMIGNLLTNAIKYTTTGEIRLETNTTGSMVTVAVRDTGTGINENQLKLIFVPFVQLDNRRVGVGLGLDIALRLAQLHGGDIQVSSTPGVGSLFTIELPVQGA